MFDEAYRGDNSEGNEVSPSANSPPKCSMRPTEIFDEAYHGDEQGQKVSPSSSRRRLVSSLRPACGSPRIRQSIPVRGYTHQGVRKQQQTAAGKGAGFQFAPWSATDAEVRRASPTLMGLHRELKDDIAMFPIPPATTRLASPHVRQVCRIDSKSGSCEARLHGLG